MRIVMLPWLAHGHISPILELAKALTTRNFSIFLCSTPANLASIKEKRLTQKDSASITLVELNLPSLPDLPPHYHTTNGLPPHLMPALKTAFDMSQPTFSNLLDTLEPDLLIYDFLHPFAPRAASERSIPSVLFLSPGAASSSYINSLKRPTLEFPFSAIYLRDYEKARVLGRMIDAVSNDVKDVDRFRQCVEQTSNIVLIKTSRALEGKYIDYLSVLIEKRVIPVGPLVQEAPIVDEKSEVLRWLDEKPRCCAVFVCFGTEYFLSREETEEIAHGLELSNVDFIWVLRFPSLGDEKRSSRVEEALPEGFVERVKGRGMVIKGWAPQGRILRHGSVGGFVSHCGWGSVMESVVFGVPIIALPMHLDQPLNSRLVEEVGVGMEVGRDASGRIERERVARGIREVLRGESGERMRRKAKELSEEMRKKGEEEMDLAVEEIVKLCRN